METISEKVKDVNQKNTTSMHASIVDGVSHAVMLGCGENYLGPFGIFLKATTLQVGILATLPQFIGAIMQWVGARKMDRFRSRRKVILYGASIQAITFIPMAFIPFIFDSRTFSVLFLLALLIIYHGSNGTAIPIWNSLIGDIVPAEIRGRFFGNRNRLTGISTFIALILAGIILHLFKLSDSPEAGFLIIFLIALFARLNSVYWLSRYDDPSFRLSADQIFTFRQFIRRSPHSNFAKFVFFIGAINFGVALSAPYFALYMLRDLHFSYIKFTMVVGVSTITQFLTFRYWGMLSDRFGSKKILNLCGWGVGIVPLLWIVSHHLFYLSIVQIFGGLVWSGYNLASTNFIFDAVTPPKRARCVAYQGLVNGIFVLSGSLIGGFIAGHLPQKLSIGLLIWEPISILPVLFLMSGLVRLIAASIFLRKFKEVRHVEPIRHRDLVFRISHIRPIAGATFSLFTGLHRETDHKKEEKQSKQK